jgi:ABC-type branched-subunit amino acid transport system ATPase component
MKIADTITVLDQGAIIAEGTPSEIAANSKVDEVYIGGSR